MKLNNMKVESHIMLDIETMGNTSRSAITSIGAVQFDINTGAIGNKFYQRVSLQSCVDIGLVMNADTVLWWLKQNEKARMELVNQPGEPNPPDIATVLSKFAEYMKICGGKECFVWGNSARFDCGIMSDAYTAVKQRLPWDFRNERCLRTLVAFNPKIKETTPFEGTMHNALDDCMHQIKYCVRTWRSLHLHEPTNFGTKLDTTGMLPGMLDGIHSGAPDETK